ncbi:shikimate kinase, partial [Streptococcus suis]
KPLKRHIEVSEAEILSTADRCQYTSLGIPEGIQHYLKINNTHLSANDVAQLIIQKMEELEQKQTK